MTRDMRLRDFVHGLLWHWPFDWYIDADLGRGRHLPGWGRMQVAQWHICNRYEKRHEPELRGTR